LVQEEEEGQEILEEEEKEEEEEEEEEEGSRGGLTITVNTSSDSDSGQACDGDGSEEHHMDDGQDQDPRRVQFTPVTTTRTIDFVIDHDLNFEGEVVVEPAVSGAAGSHPLDAGPAVMETAVREYECSSTAARDGWMDKDDHDAPVEAKGGSVRTDGPRAVAPPSPLRAIAVSPRQQAQQADRREQAQQADRREQEQQADRREQAQQAPFSPAFGTASSAQSFESRDRQTHMSSEMLAARDALVRIGVDGAVFERAFVRLLHSHHRQLQAAPTGKDPQNHSAAVQVAVSFAAVFQRALEGV
jgi:hypothetical protein